MIGAPEGVKPLTSDTLSETAISADFWPTTGMTERSTPTWPAWV